jgi:hypothetical protein
MPTLTQSTQLTLLEVAKRQHNGEMLPMAEVLHKSRPCLQHAVFVESNDLFSHVTTQRYSLPAGTFRKFNAGVPSEVGQSKQIRDTIGMLEAFADHDLKLVNSMPNKVQFRTDENVAFIEGLGQTMSSQLFYGNALVDPEKWTGLAPRMATLNTTNVQGCGGTGSDVSSIYLVQWRADRVHMVYPRGSMAGLKHTAIGETEKTDSSGYLYRVYRDHFSWDAGLVVRDPRCIARVANIETSGTTNIFDEDVLVKVKNWMRDQGRGAVGYCSINVHSQILISIKDKSNVFHSMKDPYGDGDVPALLGVPIYVDEMIVNTETAIS